VAKWTAGSPRSCEIICFEFTCELSVRDVEFTCELNCRKAPRPGLNTRQLSHAGRMPRLCCDCELWQYSPPIGPASNHDD